MRDGAYSIDCYMTCLENCIGNRDLIVVDSINESLACVLVSLNCDFWC